MNNLVKTTFFTIALIAIGAINSYGQYGEWISKSPQERAAIETQKLQKELNLSAEQLNEVEKITAHKHTEIDELMRDKDEDVEDRREELLGIWQDWDKEMEQLLEESQTRSYAGLKMEYKQKLFAAFDKKMGKTDIGSDEASEMDADIMEEDYEEIEEEIENEEDLEDALQGAEDVEFD